MIADAQPAGWLKHHCHCSDKPMTDPLTPSPSSSTSSVRTGTGSGGATLGGYPAAQAIIEVLLQETTPAEVVSLDRVAEAIGAAPVTMQDIEAILDALEVAGRRVEAQPQDPPGALARVLKAVRSFSAVSGRRPTLQEIAQQSGLSVGDVRFALLYARVLAR
jgi:hypothetical protein